MRRYRILPLSLLILLGCLGLETGCLTGDNFYGQQVPKKIDKAQVGWPISAVMEKIGRPLHVAIGTGVYIGWEEWVYPTGSIFIYRQEVRYLLPRGPNDPVPPKGKFGWQPGRKNTRHTSSRHSKIRTG